MHEVLWYLSSLKSIYTRANAFVVGTNADGELETKTADEMGGYAHPWLRIQRIGGMGDG